MGEVWLRARPARHAGADKALDASLNCAAGDRCMVILFPGKKCKGKSPAILTHQGVGCTDQHRGRVFKTASCTMWEHKFHLEGHKSKEPTVSTHTRGLLLQAGWFQRAPASGFSLLGGKKEQQLFLHSLSWTVCAPASQSVNHFRSYVSHGMKPRGGVTCLFQGGRPGQKIIATEGIAAV